MKTVCKRLYEVVDECLLQAAVLHGCAYCQFFVGVPFVGEEHGRSAQCPLIAGGQLPLAFGCLTCLIGEKGCSRTGTCALKRAVKAKYMQLREGCCHCFCKDHRGVYSSPRHATDKGYQFGPQCMLAKDTAWGGDLPVVLCLLLYRVRPDMVLLFAQHRPDFVAAVEDSKGEAGMLEVDGEEHKIPSPFEFYWWLTRKWAGNIVSNSMVLAFLIRTYLGPGGVLKADLSVQEMVDMCSYLTVW